MKPPELAGFNRDLMAAVLAGVPIEVGSPDSVADRGLLTLATMESLPLQPAATQPDRYIVALTVFDHIGVSEPILEALAARSIATSKAVRVIRWPMVYVTLIALTATLGLGFFATQVMPLIADVRADLTLGNHLNKPVYQTMPQWVGPTAIAVTIVLAALMIFMLLGGTRWLAMMFGGTAFVRSRVAAAAADVARLLRQAGVDRETANRMALDVAGADDSTRSALDDAFGVDDGIPDGSSESNTGDYFLISGNRQLARMQALAPAGLVLLLGGSIAVAYSVAIFLPVIQLLRDLQHTGV